MTLAYQRFTAVLLLIYGSLFLSGVYYFLIVFWCAVLRISELVHTALSVREFLASKQITVLEHPPCSPDLARNDFFLFENKENIESRHFDDIDDIRSNTTEAALKAIPQNQFQICFEGWTRRCYRYIASQGEYFEGDHSDIQQ
jgi:hypothetical protein